MFEERFLDTASRSPEWRRWPRARPSGCSGRCRGRQTFARICEEIRLALYGLDSEDSAEAIRAMVAHDDPVFRGR